jgi:hypothetical protein
MTKSNSESPISPTVIDLDVETIIEDRAAEQPAPPQKTRVSSGRGLLLGALVAGLLGGGFLYRNVLSSFLPTDAMTEQAEKLAALTAQNSTVQTQLQSMDTNIAAMRTELGAVSEESKTATKTAKALAPQFSTIESQLATIEATLGITKSEIENLKSSLASVGTNGTGPDINPSLLTALTARIDALEKDLASLKQAPKGQATDTAALSQSLADIKAKIANGTGYRAELDRVARMVPAADGLDVLAKYADLGLPNAKGLSAELEALIPSLPTATTTPTQPAEPSYFDQLLDALSGLITIRSLDNQDWLAIAQKSAAYADAGDLVQARSTLDIPDVALPIVLEQWRVRLDNRLALEAALDKTAEAVLREIAARG